MVGDGYEWCQVCGRKKECCWEVLCRECRYQESVAGSEGEGKAEEGERDEKGMDSVFGFRSTERPGNGNGRA